ncbi:MAG TPA: D-arabinose 5-phosphate isomerase, partial [Gammaproteobacteria bacterium]|nr:D-arabinose 5-phosphate isomerase [Gammaproteobacteria bacterium]
MTDTEFLRQGRAVIELEAAALSRLAGQLHASFDRACRALLACSGRVVVVGMGKSGH